MPKSGLDFTLFVCKAPTTATCSNVGCHNRAPLACQYPVRAQDGRTTCGKPLCLDCPDSGLALQLCRPHRRLFETNGLPHYAPTKAAK